MGKFNTHGGYFAPQDYTRINEGGSHAENPNGGVQFGVDSQGVPNMLEENEPVYQDFVYSDNIEASPEILKRFKIPLKYSGKLFSEIADAFVNEAADRPNDPISNNGLNVMLARLAEAQETQKQEAEQAKIEQQLSQLSPEELALLEQQMAQQEAAAQGQQGQQVPPEVAAQMAQQQGQVPPEQMQAMAEEQAMAEQQAMAQQQQAMAQQQMMQQPTMMANGGFIRRFVEGGPTPVVDENTQGPVDFSGHNGFMATPDQQYSDMYIQPESEKAQYEKEKEIESKIALMGMLANTDKKINPSMVSGTVPELLQAYYMSQLGDWEGYKDYLVSPEAVAMSMTPGAGTFFDLGSAYVNAERGNYVDAAMDLMGIVPLAGDFLKGTWRGIKSIPGGVGKYLKYSWPATKARKEMQATRKTVAEAKKTLSKEVDTAIEELAKAKSELQKAKLDYIKAPGDAAAEKAVKDAEAAVTKASETYNKLYTEYKSTSSDLRAYNIYNRAPWTTAIGIAGGLGYWGHTRNKQKQFDATKAASEQNEGFVDFNLYGNGFANGGPMNMFSPGGNANIRYAAPVINAAATAFSAMQPADHYVANKYNPTTVQGNMQLTNPTYNPIDTNNLANKASAGFTATQRGIQNSGLGASAGAALLANAYNKRNAVGDAFLEGQKYNDTLRANTIAARNTNAQAVANYRNNIDQFNANVLNNAQQYNLSREYTAQKANYDAESAKYSAISQGISNLAKDLYNIGTESLNMQRAAMMYGFDPLTGKKLNTGTPETPTQDPATKAPGSEEVVTPGTGTGTDPGTGSGSGDGAVKKNAGQGEGEMKTNLVTNSTSSTSRKLFGEELDPLKNKITPAQAVRLGSTLLQTPLVTTRAQFSENKSQADTTSLGVSPAATLATQSVSQKSPVAGKPELSLNFMSTGNNGMGTQYFNPSMLAGNGLSINPEFSSNTLMLPSTNTRQYSPAGFTDFGGYFNPSFDPDFRSNIPNINIDPTSLFGKNSSNTNTNPSMVNLPSAYMDETDAWYGLDEVPGAPPVSAINTNYPTIPFNQNAFSNAVNKTFTYNAPQKKYDPRFLDLMKKAGMENFLNGTLHIEWGDNVSDAIKKRHAEFRAKSYRNGSQKKKQ